MNVNQLNKPLITIDAEVDSKNGVVCVGWVGIGVRLPRRGKLSNRMSYLKSVGQGWEEMKANTRY